MISKIRILYLIIIQAFIFPQYLLIAMIDTIDILI